MSVKVRDCLAIHDAMAAGGYLDWLRQAGPELSRVMAYVDAFADARDPMPSGGPLQSPDYPLFPGLDHRPFHDVDGWPAVLELERHADLIRADWLALRETDFLAYRPPAMEQRWSAHLLHFMGVDMAPVVRGCAATRALLRSLPGVCLGYLWGDALLSVHGPGSHLKAHCSVDNLRVRCHLGLDVPEGCRIRVAQEHRTWQNGKALLFEDSFEHEVWNPGTRSRAILIVDFWNPGLRPVEVAALTAGFNQSPVREQFLLRRLQMAGNVPEGFGAHLHETMLQEDQLPQRALCWPRVRGTQPAREGQLRPVRLDRK